MQFKRMDKIKLNLASCKTNEDIRSTTHLGDRQQLKVFF